jgi:hypothetical protein
MSALGGDSPYCAVAERHLPVQPFAALALHHKMRSAVIIGTAAMCTAASAFVPPTVPLRTSAAVKSTTLNVLQEPPVYTSDVSRPISGGLVGKGVYQPEDWLNSFNSQLNEHDYEVTEIEGTLPADLEGTFFR